MQNKLTIALAAAAFALASSLAFAADMPADGTKNFTAPGDAPSYFTNETAPASARVANQATFTEDEVPAPEVGQPATDRGGKHASARRSTKHASGNKTCQIGHPPAGGGSPTDDRCSIVRLNGFRRAIARDRRYGFSTAAGTFGGSCPALDRTIGVAI
jgi:hypothetical protein